VSDARRDPPLAFWPNATHRAEACQQVGAASPPLLAMLCRLYV